MNGVTLRCERSGVLLDNYLVKCLNCSETFRPDFAVAGVRACGELIGIICESCLSPESAAALRETADRWKSTRT